MKIVPMCRTKRGQEYLPIVPLSAAAKIVKVPGTSHRSGKIWKN
jgi:hypothetical protein